MKMEQLPYFDTGLLTAFCTLIFWLSHQSGLPTPVFFPYQDKVAHFSEYAILGVLAWRCFRHQVKRPELLFLFSLAFCSLYGALDEFHQYFIPNRHVDILDWLADTVGSGLAISIMTYLRFRQQQNQVA